MLVNGSAGLKRSFGLEDEAPNGFLSNQKRHQEGRITSSIHQQTVQMMMKAQLHIQNNTQDNFQAQEEWSSNEEAVGKEKSPQKPYWPQIIKRCERK